MSIVHDPTPRTLAAVDSVVSDARVASRTIPRGASAQDRDRRPAVDPDVWLDHVRLARHGDQASLERLVAEYQTYAYSLAGRMHRGGADRDDLNQVALEALIRALQRFDPDRGFPFPAYATPTILGSLRRHFRDQGWQVRVPRSVHDHAVAERATVDRLTIELGRAPTTMELATTLGITVDRLLEAQDALHARDTCSMDHEAGEDGTSIADVLGTVDGGYELAEDRAELRAAIAGLDATGKELLRLYYVDELSQTEIADRLGVSQMQVSRLLAAVRRRLRQHLEAA